MPQDCTDFVKTGFPAIVYCDNDTPQIAALESRQAMEEDEKCGIVRHSGNPNNSSTDNVRRTNGALAQIPCSSYFVSSQPQILQQALDKSPSFKLLHKLVEKDLSKIADPRIVKIISDGLVTQTSLRFRSASYKKTQLVLFIASLYQVHARIFEPLAIRRSFAPQYIDNQQFRRPSLKGILIDGVKRNLKQGEFQSVVDNFNELMNGFYKDDRHLLDDEQIKEIVKNVVVDIDQNGIRLDRTIPDQVAKRNQWRAHGVNTAWLVQQRTALINNRFETWVKKIHDGNKKYEHLMDLNGQFVQLAAQEMGWGSANSHQIATRFESMGEHGFTTLCSKKGFTVAKIRAFLAVRLLDKPSGHTTIGAS